MKTKDISMNPIGIINTKFSGKEKMPRQGRFSKETEGYIMLDDKYLDGLLDLVTFSHAILIFYFHESEGFELIQHTKRDKKPHGVFATRSPLRPSSIGLTTVKIKSIEGNILTFYGADMINGTPLLDIKPYIPKIDSYPNANSGWIKNWTPNTK